jgi:hypothetical protein
MAGYLTEHIIACISEIRLLFKSCIILQNVPSYTLSAAIQLEAAVFGMKWYDGAVQDLVGRAG